MTPSYSTSTVGSLRNRPSRSVVDSRRSRPIRRRCAPAGRSWRNFLIAAPAPTWREAAEKARYLIGLFATTSLGRDPRRQKLIAGVLEDFSRLSGEPAAATAARESDVGGEDAE
jgi:hypothetical protein